MRRSITTALLALALVSAACSDDDAAGAPGATSTTAAVTTAAPATTALATTTTTAPVTTVAPVTTTVADVSPEPVTFTGVDEVESVITDTSRTVVLTGDLVEVVYALGAADRIAAVDVTAAFPAEANALPKVGFGQQLAAEAVLSFGPTLVIGDQLVGPQESIDQIRSAGVPVVILETQTTLDGVTEKIGQVAEILGLEDEGRTVSTRVAAEIAEAQELAARAASPQNVAFVYIRGPETLLLFGQGMVTQAMIEGANAIDTGAVAGVRGAVPLTPEALVSAAPDVIVLPSLGLEALGGLDAFRTIPGVAETPAGRDDRFLEYEDTFFLNFGPRTGQALRTLVLDLYPELAEGA
ncbi:MAG: hemin ABC transporter substrate-binding protein [Acidimicrobiia bacterium]